MAIEVNFSEAEKSIHIALLWQWSKRWNAREKRIKLLSISIEDREYETGMIRDQDEVFDYLDSKAQRIAKTPLTVILTATPPDDQKRQCILERSAIFAIPNGFDTKRFNGVGPVDFLVSVGYNVDAALAKRELAEMKAYWEREQENWITD